NNLNLTGNFLEASVFYEMSQNKDLLVTAEWPFSFNKVGGKVDGIADIIAVDINVKWGSEPLVFFAIECKKVKTDQKVWIFDRHKGSRDITHPFLRISTEG